MKSEMMSMRLSKEDIKMIEALLKKGYAATRSALYKAALREYYQRRLGEKDEAAY